MYRDFINSEEAQWWTTIAERMVVSWYFVVYSTDGDKINNKFHVWRSDGVSRKMNRADFAGFLTKL